MDYTAASVHRPIEETSLRKRSAAGSFLKNVPSLFLVLSVIPWLFGACVHPAPSEAPVLNQPETKVMDVQSSVAMDALKRVLNNKKFKINAQRTNAQVLETEWLQDGSYRSMVLAEISPLEKYRSQLSLQLLVQKKALLQETWHPVDTIDKTVYTDFFNDVLIESYRVLYERR